MIKYTRGHLGRVFLLKQTSFKKRYKDEKLKIRTSYLHLLVVHHLPDPLVHDHHFLDIDQLVSNTFVILTLKCECVPNCRHFGDKLFY